MVCPTSGLQRPCMSWSVLRPDYNVRVCHGLSYVRITTSVYVMVCPTSGLQRLYTVVVCPPSGLQRLCTVVVCPTSELQRPCTAMACPRSGFEPLRLFVGRNSNFRPTPIIHREWNDIWMTFTNHLVHSMYRRCTVRVAMPGLEVHYLDHSHHHMTPSLTKPCFPND
jgi:hypothetical protein